MMAHWLLVRALESILARILRPEEQATRHALSHLRGKVIAFDIRPAPGVIYFCPHSEGIQVLREFSATPDLRLTGPAWAFLRLAMGQDASELLFKGSIRLQGKADLAQRFNQLLAEMQLPGMEIIANTANAIAHYGDTLSEKLWQDGQELLQEETRTTPTRVEADAQFSAIDRLRDDVERLEARIMRLSAPEARANELNCHQDISES